MLGFPLGNYAFQNNLFKLCCVRNFSWDLQKFQGWVRNVRKSKSLMFLDLLDGHQSRILQIVVPKNEETQKILQKISPGCSISVVGRMESETENVNATQVRLLGSCPHETYPLRHGTNYSNDFLRKYLHLRGRTDLFRSLLSLRSEASYAIHSFFRSNRFLLIHPPVISSMDCEGAGDLFTVKASDGKGEKEDFFRGTKYLTVSGQFHLEAMTSGNSRVYSFGPTFRADKSHTRRHLAEFYMVECELAFCDTLQQLTQLAEELCRSVIGTVLDRWTTYQGGGAGECLGEENKRKLTDMLAAPFQTMTYSEAVGVVRSSGVRLEWGEDLHAEAEHSITQKFNRPVFVTNYPAELKPFYMLQDDVIKNGKRETVACFDLLWPGLGEVAGGSLREHRLERLERAMNVKIANSQAKSELEWYVDLRRYGAVSMGGFGLGFERLLQVIAGMDIRDTIPFPRFYRSCSY